METLVKQDQISIMGGALGNSYKSCSLTLEAKRKMAKNILAWWFLQEEKSGRGVHFAMYPTFIQKVAEADKSTVLFTYH